MFYHDHFVKVYPEATTLIDGEDIINLFQIATPIC